MLWRCSPHKASISVKQCKENADRFKAAQSMPASNGEAMLARIQLKPCEGCPGIVARFECGLEPEPREIGPIHQLVTDARSAPPIVVPIIATKDPLARLRKDRRSRPPRPRDVVVHPESATHCRKGHDLTDPANVFHTKEGGRMCRLCRMKAQRPTGALSPRPPGLDTRRLMMSRGVILYETGSGRSRVRFSTRTRDWNEAVAIRDAFEKDGTPPGEVPMAEQRLCACGCGQPVPWSGRGRRPIWVDKKHKDNAYYKQKHPPKRDAAPPEPKPGETLEAQLKARREKVSIELRAIDAALEGVAAARKLVG